MTDNTDLKRLARRVIDIEALDGGEPIGEAWGEFEAAATPAAVLALIAENEELGRYLCTCRDCGGEGALHTGDWHSYGHMEPPEPVMEKCGECDGTGLLGEVQDLYQVITERDQLCAEVAGLKTGYEAYERVNAELKAEVEKLRKELAARHPFKFAQESPAIGFTGCVICGVYTDHGGLPCPKTRATAIAHAAMGKGERS